jgi:hypothetical protein
MLISLYYNAITRTCSNWCHSIMFSPPKLFSVPSVPQGTFYLPSLTWSHKYLAWEKIIIQLLVIYSQSCVYLFRLMSKYSSQAPSFCVGPLRERTSSTPLSNKKQNFIFIFSFVHPDVGDRKTKDIELNKLLRE